MESLWREGDLPEDFSCTTGSVHCLPDVGIAVPQTVTFTLDTRHVSPAVLAEGRERILALARAVATARGLRMDHVPLSASGGTRLSPEAGEAFRAAARRHGAETLSLVSGPAHDAAALGKIVPAGLLFVPSAGGFSHCPQEHTEPEDLALGAKCFRTPCAPSRRRITCRRPRRPDPSAVSAAMRRPRPSTFSPEQGRTKDLRMKRLLLLLCALLLAAPSPGRTRQPKSR